MSLRPQSSCLFHMITRGLFLPLAISSRAGPAPSSLPSGCVAGPERAFEWTVAHRLDPLKTGSTGPGRGWEAPVGPSDSRSEGVFGCNTSGPRKRLAPWIGPRVRRGWRHTWGLEVACARRETHSSYSVTAATCHPDAHSRSPCTVPLFKQRAPGFPSERAFQHSSQLRGGRPRGTGPPTARGGTESRPGCVSHAGSTSGDSLEKEDAPWEAPEKAGATCDGPVVVTVASQAPQRVTRGHRARERAVKNAGSPRTPAPRK